METMADFFAPRRKFFMHPAHRAVGVLGARSVLSSHGETESWKTEPETELKHILLVADAKDYLAQASLALFERILLGHGNVRCHRVPYASAGMERLAGADCTVIFSRGFHVVRGWTDVNTDFLLDDATLCGDVSEMELDVAAVGQHPILDGVGEFKSVCQIASPTQITQNSICMLAGKASGQVFPVGWVHQGCGRMFSTLLGQPEDFHRRAFVRLALNAVDWVSER
jgi:hypothetical protein